MNNDQAGSLRQLAEETETPVKSDLSLPPRREFHQRKKKSNTEEDTSAVVSERLQERKPFPLLKLIVAAFLLLIAATFTYELWSDKLFKPIFTNQNEEPVQVQIEK